MQSRRVWGGARPGVLSHNPLTSCVPGGDISQQGGLVGPVVDEDVHDNGNVVPGPLGLGHSGERRQKLEAGRPQQFDPGREPEGVFFPDDLPGRGCGQRRPTAIVGGQARQDAGEPELQDDQTLFLLRRR